MKRTFSIAASLFVFVSIVACGSSSTNSNGGSGGACTVTTNGTVTSCRSWGGNYPAADESALCPTGSNSTALTYTTVASCPTASELGTCTTTISSGGTSLTSSETFYSVNGDTCANEKQACSSVSGTGFTTSFSGNGC